jgi:uncharacterized lipoprotein YmbA
VPADVDRPQIVVRVSANEVRMDEFNRWAAPLPEEFSRVIVENLEMILGTTRVTSFPRNPSGDAAFRVSIDVRRFESELGKVATLDMVWTVKRANDGAARTEHIAVREIVPDNGYDSLAAAHSRAVAQLSQNIANAIQALASP